jgi:hypothetical protein
MSGLFESSALSPREFPAAFALTLKKVVPVAFLCTLWGCQGASPDASAFKFDAAHGIALDATITEGVILSATDSEPTLKSEIEEQLMYAIGQLNGIGGGPDMNRLQISLQDVAPLEEGGFRATYTAQLFVAWPRERTIPESYTFILPSRGDWQGVSEFFDAYGADETTGKRCLDWGAHDVSSSMFWYYYRPEKFSCPLRVTEPDEENPGLATRINATINLSDKNTEGKSPEYGKVWQDDKLIVTAIFGKNEHGATSNWDAGISAYRGMYRDLLARFGEPDSTNLPEGESPDSKNHQLELTFQTTSGELDIHIYLVNGIRSVDRDFMSRYNARTRDSDFVSYSGHSGLGANIRALARMGEFVKDQYQLFLINGCDTFAYVDNSLRDAHHLVNPDHGKDKYFDIITNAMPSYFHMNATANMAVISGLVSQSQTYREILAGFDRNQRAAVTGEEDNRWPLSFED